jgi:hypothetical protein
MAKNLAFCFSPDPFGQIDTELSNIDRFRTAQAAVKSKNPDWETLSGIRYLSGFTGGSYSSSRNLIKTGKIRAYKIGGTYYFLVKEVINAINEYPSIGHSNWLSYEDNLHSQDELIIHSRRYRYTDHILIKFSYLRWTSYIILPPEFWGKDARIAKVMIKEINKRNKLVPFQANPL